MSPDLTATRSNLLEPHVTCLSTRTCSLTLRLVAGGNGRHRGGDGCIRDIEFTEDLDVAILSQRRVIPPYGMAGGEPGVVGVNQWWKGTKEGKHTIINLGGSNQTRMKKGDHIVISMLLLFYPPQLSAHFPESPPCLPYQHRSPGFR